jgi:hypothetical protein
MERRELDTVLGRTVQVAVAERSSELQDCMNLSDSTVMLLLGNGAERNGEVERVLSSVLAAAPLALMLFGANASTSFDRMLSLQARLRTPHVMTKLAHSPDLPEAIDEFLHATWPSEERFHQWRTYSILIIGNDPSIDEAIAAVRIAIDAR